MSSMVNTNPVVVTVSDCTADDARRVLTYLASGFADRTVTSETTTAASGSHPTVWTAEHDVGAGASPAAAGDALTGPVSLTAQGAPHDVDSVRAALVEVFSVDDAGSASGDQERESQFRLTSR